LLVTWSRRTSQPTASIDSPSARSDTANKYNPSPPALSHSINHALYEEKRRSQINVESRLKLLELDVPDIYNPFAIACIGYQDLDMASMLSLDLSNEAADISGQRKVSFMNADIEIFDIICLLELKDESFELFSVAAVGESQVHALGAQLACACSPDATSVSKPTMNIPFRTYPPLAPVTRASLPFTRVCSAMSTFFLPIDRREEKKNRTTQQRAL
jgi:hypothetical protein